jgi:hypothetical protein
MDEELVKATNLARLRALNGPNADQMIANADKGYWGYAGNVGAGGAAQQIASNADPYLTALKNQGMMGTAATKGMYDVEAADIAGQSRMGAAEIAGNATTGAARINAGATGYKADKDLEGVTTRADVDKQIAKIKEDAANGRASAEQIALGNRLLQSIMSNERIEGMRGKTQLGVAETNANRPYVVPMGASMYTPNGQKTDMSALGSLVAGTGSGVGKTATAAEVAAYAQAQGMTDAQAREQLKSMGYSIQ